MATPNYTEEEIQFRKTCQATVGRCGGTGGLSGRGGADDLARKQTAAG